MVFALMASRTFSEGRIRRPPPIGLHHHHPHPFFRGIGDCFFTRTVQQVVLHGATGEEPGIYQFDEVFGGMVKGEADMVDQPLLFCLQGLLHGTRHREVLLEGFPVHSLHTLVEVDFAYLHACKRSLQADTPTFWGVTFE